MAGLSVHDDFRRSARRHATATRAHLDTGELRSLLLRHHLPLVEPEEIDDED